MLAMLAAIRTLLAWAESHQISLEKHFGELQVLRESQLESLRAYAQARQLCQNACTNKAFVSLRGAERARASLQHTEARISSGTHYIRLTYMADYLDWLAVQVLESMAVDIQGKALDRIRMMTHSLRSRRPQKIAPSRLSARKGLSRESQLALLALAKPGVASNPFHGPSLQQRNEVAVLLLYHLGIRSGELLALKVSDFDFQKNEVVISRRHGDPSDPRRTQPVAKTLDRRVPLSNALSTLVSNYVLTGRREFAQSKRHSFLLVTQQVGPHQGRPLSLRGLAKIFTTIQRAEPSRLQGLTAHVLRHTANDNFSGLMDSLKVPSPSEEKMRSYWMGWREGSGSAADYTRRHIEQKAREVSLKLQEGLKVHEKIKAE